MNRFLVLGALVALACITVSDVYAMGEIVQASVGMSVAAPAAFAALATLSRPRSVIQIRAEANDPATVLASLRQSFETFKAEHTAALAKKADIVTDEKVERINTAVGELQATLDELAIKMAAAGVHGPATRPGDDAAYNDLFTTFARTGDGESQVKAQQFQGPRAAMSVGSNPDGGLTAPIEWDRTITDKLKIVSAMRGLARVISISTSGFSKLFNDRNTASGWVGETDNRPATGQAQFSSVTFGTGELYAMPTATQTLLEDSLVDISAWLANEVETEFAYQEGIAFVNGNGANKPKGFLQYTAGNSHPFGAVPTINTSAAADLTSDGIVDLVHDLPSERTPDAKFVMNRKTQGRIRKLKDGDGRYLWAPMATAGTPATLLGFPIVELAAMPDVAANAIPIVFGDFMRGYLIVDRIGVQVLRDPYTSKPYVQFYTRKRVGGGITDPTCLRYHKVSA